MSLDNLGTILAIIIFGMMWGSYSTTAISCILHNKPWIGSDPRCFKCNSRLYMIDFFPIVIIFSI